MWRYIKPNRLRDLFDKYAKDYIAERFEMKGIVKKPQYDIFSAIAKNYLNLLIDEVVGGEDVKTEAGTFVARQVKDPNFRATRFTRKFDLDGGREYDIFDLLRRGGRYPVFMFKNNGLLRYRNVMWRSYVKLRLVKRHNLYKKFYDENFEYKEFRYPKEKRKKSYRTIWRNKQKLRFKI